jgi:tRNA threonylcarbamoyladenosine biosynthesis protein TsaE
MPILAPQSMEFISRSAEQTRRMGMRLGGLLRPADVVGLSGDLGAGKTTFVQGLASGWGSLDTVTSPTFVLVNMYRRPTGTERTPAAASLLYHLDAYRLAGTPEQIQAQMIDLDLDTMLATGVLVVEWAERVQEVLPDGKLTVSMKWVDENQRDLTFTAEGVRYERLLASLKKQTFG